jgi:uncharacterized membrane protein
MYFLKNTTYLFLFWNLFLAWIPVIVTLSIDHLRHIQRFAQIKTIFLWMAVITWLLFFPNSLYIFTDFIHFKEIKTIIPSWYDILMLFSYSWNGMVLAFFSLRVIHVILIKRYGLTRSWGAIGIIFLLSSFAIYIGRFLRWNSWDVIVNPSGLLYDVADRFTSPTNYPGAYGVTVLFAVFFFFAYVSFITFDSYFESPSKK